MAYLEISLEAFIVAGFLGQLSTKAGMVSIRDVILRPLDRIFERIMGFHNFAEAGFIASLLIVWMIAHRKVTEYAL
ncbi:hypothetical protein X727_08855 [Mesorhizobium sp. L103C119B0]|nr:hypothetical protein X727_08855 [Mesorhizobium sp. L103C119B0]